MIESNQLTQHISRQFNAELEGVRSHILTMGGLVEQQINDALQALRSGDSELAERVVRDDYKVNALEVTVDEECTRILARRQPTASDLRMIVAVIKTITDLERMGDEAEKIARMALHMSGSGDGWVRYTTGVQPLGYRVRRMTHDALDAFARLDTEAALQVAREDISADQEYEVLMRQLITFMMEDPRSISTVLDVMWAARALERIGDHARNVCEYVVYLVHGKDVRHTSLEQVAQTIRQKT
jgi:phosphate transport system protein